MIFSSFEATVDFQESLTFITRFEDSSGFDVDFGYTPPVNEYAGSYEVTPTSQEQYLVTANKTLTANVNVHATPYTEASNQFGGMTATIL